MNPVALYRAAASARGQERDRVKSRSKVDARSIKAIREWCDRTEAAARRPPLSITDDEAVFQARMDLVDEVRALLPEVTS